MFAQISTFSFRSGTETRVVDAFKKRVIPGAQKLTGFVKMDLFTRSRLNRGMVISYWETEHDAGKLRDSGALEELWAPVKQYLIEGPETHGYEPNIIGESAQELANQETVRRANAAFSQKDMKGLLDCYAETAVQYEPFIKEPIAGKEALHRYFDGSFRYFPDETITIDRLMSLGDWVVGMWRCQGTHSGEFLGMPPTGRRFDVPEAGIYQFRHGLVQNLWVYVDSGTIAKQFGYKWVREAS